MGDVCSIGLNQLRCIRTRTRVTDDYSIPVHRVHVQCQRLAVRRVDELMIENGRIGIFDIIF